MSLYNFEPICPNCGNAIDDGEITDQEIDFDQIVTHMEGTCDRCGTDCTWEEIYEYKGCRNVEEE